MITTTSANHKTVSVGAIRLGVGDWLHVFIGDRHLRFRDTPETDLFVYRNPVFLFDENDDLAGHVLIHRDGLFIRTWHAGRFLSPATAVKRVYSGARGSAPVYELVPLGEASA